MITADVDFLRDVRDNFIRYSVFVVLALSLYIYLLTLDDQGGNSDPARFVVFRYAASDPGDAEGRVCPACEQEKSQARDGVDRDSRSDDSGTEGPSPLIVDLTSKD